jgi:drug/metabolite transporter (DMT)-like permease
MNVSASRRKAAVALALVSLVWGYNWVTMKVGLSYAGPFQYAALRFSIAALILIPFGLWTGERLWPSRNQWGPIFILGVGLAGNFGGCFTALKLGGAGKTAVLTYTMPFWVLIFARLALHEILSRWQWLSVAVALVGLGILVEPWNLHGAVASLIAVAGGMSWGATVVYVKHLQRHRDLSSFMLILWQMIIGSACLALAAVSFEHTPVSWTMEFWLALGYTTLFGSVIAWILFYYALRRLPAGMTGLGTLATPVIGVLCAAMQLGERPTATELAGMLLIGGALTMLAWTPTRVIPETKTP